MNILATLVDNRFRRTDPTNHPFQFLDLVFWGRNRRYVGFVLGEDVVVVDYKFCTSFRLKVCNILTIPHVIDVYACQKVVYDQAYIESYLRENKDNPYGVWNILRTAPKVTNSDAPFELTQFPPLLRWTDTGQRRADIDKMYDLARPGDVVFTYDRASGLARLIRDADKGMWSHCATVLSDKALGEATTSGVVRSDFHRLGAPNLDVGLYRCQQELTDEEARTVTAYAEAHIGAQGYPWRRVIRIYLQKRFGIPYRRGPSEFTPADLMYLNTLRLVCYA
ncbi:MAG TPA: hypothetical protein VMV10_19340 [Pirellulales bacterium]|nr:hypothetical protein [Pirellulales bacterium]